MPYSEVGDLLTGNIPLPGTLLPAKFVQDATDEIDGALGQVYITPIVLDPGVPAVRPSVLTLKRINNLLASGRLIMAADAGGQDQTLHAYGLSLIKEAHDALSKLRESSDTLPGAIPIEYEDTTATVRGPRILNEDDHSHVAAFYGYVDPSRVTTNGPRLY